MPTSALEVPAPAGVDRRWVRGERSPDQVRACVDSRVGDGGPLEPLEPLGLAALQPGGAHQPGDPLTAVPLALVG